ncbi:YdgH/BhsA/McbA-like domain containing protein, partial [Escherichia coli]|uniref:YdgH/BhsA/McbA-like domain containing protein n=1 Tax=Escherichia coli TaxID=562 RepID=UPI0013B3C423
TINSSGNTGKMPKVSNRVANGAAKKGPNFSHIPRQWQERGNNLTVSADLYK